MPNFKTVAAFDGKLNSLVEHEPLIHQIPKTPAPPSALVVGQGALHRVDAGLAIGKPVGQEHVEVGIRIDLGVANIQQHVVPLEGVFDIPMKRRSFLAGPA